MNRITQCGLVLLFSLCLIPICGCGPEKTKEVMVTGSITIDGEPLEEGSIQFVSVEGETPTGGGTIINGTYTAQVSPGAKKVLVLAYEVVGEEPEYEGVADSPMREVRELVTPEAYNAKHLTPLEATITDADMEGVDFELTSDL